MNEPKKQTQPGKDQSAHPVSQLINPKNLALLQKSDRFVIMSAGLIVIAALGALTSLRDSPTLSMWIALSAMLIVAALVILVQWRAFLMKDMEADLLSQAKAAASVNGDWWEIVFDKKHPGLSYVSLSVSEVAERHAMHGIALDENGCRQARWSSDAIAIKTTTPVELYYMWRGMKFISENVEVISGMGRFRFDSVGRESRPLQGEGAFTRGSTAELNFRDPIALELVRFTEQESIRLQQNPEALKDLASEAFQRFGLEKGRSFD